MATAMSTSAGSIVRSPSEHAFVASTHQASVVGRRQHRLLLIAGGVLLTGVTLVFVDRRRPRYRAMHV